MLSKSHSEISSEAFSLFGYFYTEIDGFERILVKETLEKWKFPINVEFSPNLQTVNEAIDFAITSFFNDVGENINLLLEQRFDPVYYRVFIGPNANLFQDTSEGRTGFFFKIKLENELVLPDGYKWSLKSQLFDNTESCLDLAELAAIKRNCVYTYLGHKVLECIDALVFRINESQVEFLILKREDPIRGFVGWEYPKGGIQFHENPLEGALHRLKIETGSNKYNYRGYLGIQNVDVSDRKLAEYNTLRVHGLTFLFTGKSSEVIPEDFKVILRTPTWVSWEKARESIWMKTYGPEFFDRWLSQKEIIMHNLA